MPATVGPNSQQQTFALSGGYFAYTSATTATLTVSGFDGYCHVEVGNAISKRVVSFNAAKTMNLTVAGPGGLHQDHAEAASTVYTIYLAWMSATAARNGTCDLFSVPSGTTIDAAKLTALGAGYDYVSRPIGFVANDAGSNIVPFQQVGDWWSYKIADGIQILNQGKAVADTAISAVSAIPAEATKARVWLFSYNAGATRDCLLKTNKGGTLYQVDYFTGVYDAAGYARYQAHEIYLPITSAPATWLNYIWTPNAPSTGLSVFVESIQITDTDREGP